jgi:hypothetical protein
MIPSYDPPDLRYLPDVLQVTNYRPRQRGQAQPRKQAYVPKGGEQQVHSLLLDILAT